MFEYKSTELKAKLDEELNTLERLNKIKPQSDLEHRYYSMVLDKALLLRRAIKELEE